MMSASVSSVHSVQFYDTDEAFITRLCTLVTSGNQHGHRVLIVVTKRHRNQLVKALETLEVDVQKYKKERRLTLCDARKTLSQLMVRGRLDLKRLAVLAGRLVGGVQKNVGKPEPGLVVSGEMAAILWAEKNKAAALALEKFWHDLSIEKAFDLHCAYPWSLFLHDKSGMRRVCDIHSYTLGLLNPASLKQCAWSAVLLALAAHPCASLIVG